MKKPVSKDCILYNSINLTFLKRQNNWVGEHQQLPVWRREEGKWLPIKGQHEGTLCSVLYWDRSVPTLVVVAWIWLSCMELSTHVRTHTRTCKTDDIQIKSVDCNCIFWLWYCIIDLQNVIIENSGWRI